MLDAPLPSGPFLMSASLVVARADWAKLREVVAEHPSYEELREFSDYSSDWWSEPESDEWWDYFLQTSYALYFMEEIYEDLRGGLSEEERRVTDPVANLVAGCYYDSELDRRHLAQGHSFYTQDYYTRNGRNPEGEFYERPFDLGEQYRRIEEESDLLAVLSPGTVRRYLALWERVPFEKLQAGFEALTARRSDDAEDSEWEFVEDYIEDWSRFRGYFDVFRGELERASAKGGPLSSNSREMGQTSVPLGHLTRARRPTPGSAAPHSPC